jgi:ubiquinone/menaquinone biosynthesis C-methylase UbiE
LKVPKILLKPAEKILEILAKVAPIRIKRIRELYYWKFVKEEEKDLSSRHYQDFFTSNFDLNSEFYFNKKILDIGCGPRGSLEWADMTSERIGLDPLADKYLKLGADKHKMAYVNAPVEKIPFDEDYFDVVSSFNSLDHVDDIDKTIKEIKRVLKPKGIFLLITDVNHEPTVTEPLTFSWDIINEFKPEFEKIEEKHYENQNGIYRSIRENVVYDHTDITKRPGVLSVKFKKK